MAKNKVEEHKYKGNIVGARFTQAEYNNLKLNAELSGLKLGALVRNLALKGSVKARFSEEELEYKRQIIGIANNLNQLTHLAHKTGFKTIEFEAQKVINELTKFLTLRNGK